GDVSALSGAGSYAVGERRRNRDVPELGQVEADECAEGAEGLVAGYRSVGSARLEVGSDSHPWVDGPRPSKADRPAIHPLAAQQHGFRVGRISAVHNVFGERIRVDVPLLV